MRALRSWRVEGKDATTVMLEESGQPDEIRLVIERAGDMRRIWLSREAFEALMDLRYDVRWAEPEG